MTTSNVSGEDDDVVLQVADDLKGPMPGEERDWVVEPTRVLIEGLMRSGMSRTAAVAHTRRQVQRGVWVLDRRFGVLIRMVEERDQSKVTVWKPGSDPEVDPWRRLACEFRENAADCRVEAQANPHNPWLHTYQAIAWDQAANRLDEVCARLIASGVSRVTNRGV